ncbi:MAG: hypothetical protein KDI71_03525 [Xanthomonadales bacterium]|nr:hypothetical protein [Xanthomonadales bacterium]
MKMHSQFGLMLAMVTCLSACSEPPSATPGGDEGGSTQTEATNPQHQPEPPGNNTPALSPPAAVPRKPAPQTAIGYFEQISAQLAQRLSEQTEDCETRQPHLQDDCISSANSQHEAAMADARLAYEAQLAEEAQSREE